MIAACRVDVRLEGACVAAVVMRKDPRSSRGRLQLRELLSEVLRRANFFFFIFNHFPSQLHLSI